METTGTPTFQLAVSADDLPQVAKAFDDRGPFTSVYLTTEPNIDNASHRSELRWKDLVRDMHERGGPEAPARMSEHAVYLRLRRRAPGASSPTARPPPLGVMTESMRRSPRERLRITCRRRSAAAFAR